MSKLAAVRLGWIGALLLISSRFLFREEFDPDISDLLAMAGIMLVATAVASWIASPEKLVPPNPWRALPAKVRLLFLVAMALSFITFLGLAVWDQMQMAERARYEEEARAIDRSIQVSSEFGLCLKRSEEAWFAQQRQNLIEKYGSLGKDLSLEPYDYIEEQVAYESCLVRQRKKMTGQKSGT